MLPSPPPSLPASFPHMVLIRSGLRDSSQRKWLCTESFCEGRRGEGERAERKKERGKKRGWEEAADSRTLPDPPRAQGLSFGHPRVRFLNSALSEVRGPEEAPVPPDPSHLPADHFLEVLRTPALSTPSSA